MKKKWKIFASLGAVLFAAFATIALVQKSSSNEISFREEMVKRRTIELRVLSTGTVEPENRLAIKPPIAGRVEEVVVKEGELVKRGQILAWMSSSERAALLDAARADGAQAVKRWEKNYKPTPILAPIDGTIISRNVETGQTFTNVDAVFTMSDRLTVKAQVDETDIGQIKVGQNAEIALDAYRNLEIRARVDHIAFDAQTVNNVTTYVVTVIPSEVPAQMRSGMTANVNFEIESKADILTISNEAVGQDGSQQIVLVRSPSGAPHNKVVQIGTTDGKISEVLSGLEDGETVLIKEFKKTKVSDGSNPFMPTPGRRRAR